MTSLTWIAIVLLVSVISVAVAWLLHRRQMRQLQQQINQYRIDLTRSEEQYQGLQRSLTEQQRRADGLSGELQQQVENAAALRAELKARNTELALLHQQHDREMQEREQRLNQELKLAQEQLKTAATEILQQQSRGLNEGNRQQMSQIIDPLKEQIREMKQSMEQHREQSIRQSAEFGEKFGLMIETTRLLGNKADNLAEALKGRQSSNKLQGNWGEDVLRVLLDEMGMQEGIHYDRQYTIRQADGTVIKNEDSRRNMIPDVVLHYPDKKDVIIDSKVSLSAYADYYDAQTDEQRGEALQRHVRSVRSHVLELSGKRYNDHMKNGHQQLDFVVMFMPVDAALYLALQAEPTLWNDAFYKYNVFICNTMMLTPLLRMIQASWRQEQQNKQQENLFNLADKLVSRIAVVVERFADMGRKIDALQKSYDDSSKALSDGRGNLKKLAGDMIRLGAKQDPKHPLLPSADEDDDSPAEA